MSNQTLPKHRLIRKNKDFQTIFKMAKRIHTPSFCFYQSISHQTQSRIAVIVSKKVSKKAVIRNRIRRQIKELYRTHPNQPTGTDLIIAAKPAVVSRSYDTLQSHWLK